MAEYYEIKVDDIWLTKDGTEKAAGIGQRVALQVEGVDRLQSSYTKVLRRDFRNNPIIQKTLVGTAGRGLVIRMSVKLPKAVAEMLISLHQTSEAANTAFRLQGSDGDTPDFDVFVLPSVDAFRFRDFDGFGNYIGAELYYVTVGDMRMRDEDLGLIDDTFRMIDS